MVHALIEPVLRTTTHTTAVAAPPERVYALIADVLRWPQIFPPTVHVRRLEAGPDTERLQLWALAHGDVRTWTSRRELDPGSLTVTFRQEVSAAPVLTMGGSWHVEAEGDGCRVTLLHDYRVIDDDDDAESAELVEQAVERNSTAELAALARFAELSDDPDELWLTFTDDVRIDGAAHDVYEFLACAHHWPQRLPHVVRLRMDEEVPDVQQISMDTRSPDGSVHTTESVRICFPITDIVYKQGRPPAALGAHTGHWTVTEVDGAVHASSQHTVVLDPVGVAGLLGPDATLAQARVKVREALGANSLATLNLAKQFAESRAAAAARSVQEAVGS